MQDISHFIVFMPDTQRQKEATVNMDNIYVPVTEF